MASCFSASVKNQALLWDGKLGIMNQPSYRGQKCILGNILERNHTKDDDGERHDGDDDEEPPPGRQASATIQRAEQTCLNPRSGHTSQMTKDAKDCCTGAEL